MKARILFSLCCAASLLSAVTITLRNGQKVSGDILRMDDTNLVLKTVTGPKTFSWRQLSNDSIKQTNPNLYHRLLEQAHERLHQQTQTIHAATATISNLHHDATSPSPNADLANIRLSISTATRVGERVPTTPERKKALRGAGWSREHANYCHGELTVRLEGLNPALIYSVRVKTTLYLQMITSGTIDGANVQRSDHKVEGTGVQAVTNASTARLEFLTHPYIERTRSGGGGSARTKGRVKYWDISIWINDILVYETKDDKPPVFYHVKKK